MRYLGLGLLLLAAAPPARADSYAPQSNVWEIQLPAGCAAKAGAKASSAVLACTGPSGASIDIRGLTKPRSIRPQDLAVLRRFDRKRVGAIPGLEEDPIGEAALAAHPEAVQFGYRHGVEGQGEGVIVARSVWLALATGSSYFWVRVHGRAPRDHSEAFLGDFQRVVASLRVPTAATPSTTPLATPAATGSVAPSITPTATPSIPPTPVATSPATPADWKAIFAEAIVPGQGIGRLRLGADAVPLIADALGPCGVIDHNSRGEIYYYSRQFDEPDLAIHVNQGRIHTIHFGANFPGYTAAGVTLGHSYDDVLQAHGEPKALYPGWLPYNEGIDFRFSNKVLTSIMVSRPGEGVATRDKSAPKPPQSDSTDWTGRYQFQLERCKRNAIGTARVAHGEATPEVKERIERIDVPAYCDCLFEKQWAAFGPEVTVRWNASYGLPELDGVSPHEINQMAAERSLQRQVCVEAATR